MRSFTRRPKSEMSDGYGFFLWIASEFSASFVGREYYENAALRKRSSTQDQPVFPLLSSRVMTFAFRVLRTFEMASMS